MSHWIFDAVAPIYDRLAWPWAAADRHELVKLLNLQPGDRVLDVGGGTGALAQAILERTRAAVTVLDSSQAMLAQLPRHPRLTAVHGLAHSLPFHADTFDWVVCTAAFSLLAPHETSLAAMRRVLKSSGRLLIQDYDRVGLLGPMLDRVMPWFQRDAKIWSRQEVLDLLKTQGLEGQLVGYDLMQYSIAAIKQP